MFHAPDILIDRKPFRRRFGAERRVAIMRIGVAIEVPRRIYKRIHSVTFAPRIAAAHWTGNFAKCRMRFQWGSSLPGNRNITRKQYGEILSRNRYNATLGAVD